MNTPSNEGKGELPRSEPELIDVLEPGNARRLAEAASGSRDVSGPGLPSVAGLLFDVVSTHNAALVPLFPQLGTLASGATAVGAFWIGAINQLQGDYHGSFTPR